MNKKKILILGSGGFIGTNLTKYFSQKEEYNVFDHNYSGINKRKLRADLTNKEEVEWLFDFVKPEVVLQYAAYTTNSKDVVESPFNHSTTNYCINALVLEAAHKSGVKHFIYPSCATMYESADYAKREEDWNLDTIPKQYSHVAYMKTAVERMMKAYSEMGKCKYTVIRQSNVFGPHDKTDLDKCHVFNAMVNKVVNAKDSIEVWGGPVNQAKRDLIYVDDVVNMVDLIIQKQETPYEIFNCGAGVAYSISEIIETISKIEGKNLKLVYNTSKPNIPTTTILNIDKAKKILGWEPNTSFIEGTKKTLEWYKSQ
jgi:nucleoside-diphosphate-sugar epimerase